MTVLCLETTISWYDTIFYWMCSAKDIYLLFYSYIYPESVIRACLDFYF